jgi:hypothetical protein
MPQFERKFEVGGGILTFQFHRIYYVNGIKYFIAVMDKVLQPHIFTMQVERGEWKIIDTSKLPAWILELEPLLAAAIEERLG